MDDERDRITGPTVLRAELRAFHFHKGVSHAPWPEEKHGLAPKEAICWPLTAAATDYAARRATGFSQREKKLDCGETIDGKSPLPGGQARRIVQRRALRT